MFFRDFVTLTNIKQKLLQKIADREREINQPITMRDIFIYPMDPARSYGESKKFIYPDQTKPTLDRLVDHIHTFAIIGNLYHQTYYCEEINGERCIKKEFLNHITCLSLPEFSLYPKEPITEQQFVILIEKIVEIAKKQSQNLHLFLCSLPLLVENDIILNLGMYVQCGPEPQIQVFSKAASATDDINYFGKTLFSHYEKNSDLNNVSHFSRVNQTLVNHNQVFTVETAGGGQYTQAIDICLDHQYNMAKKLMGYIIDLAAPLRPLLIPAQVNYTVSSNSIPIVRQNLFTKTFVHIDPRYDTPSTMLVDKVKVEHLNNTLQEIFLKYPRMKIIKIDDYAIIENPPFGFSYTIAVQPERKLLGFSSDLEKSVLEANASIKKHLVTTISETVLKEKLESKDGNEKAGIVKKLEDLYDELLQCCNTGFFETLINTQHFKMKSDVAKIIFMSHRYIKAHLKDSADKDLTAIVHELAYLKAALVKLSYDVPLILDQSHYTSCNGKSITQTQNPIIFSFVSKLFPKIDALITDLSKHVDLENGRNI